MKIIIKVLMVLIIFSGICEGRANKLKKEKYMLTETAIKYIIAEKKQNSPSYTTAQIEAIIRKVTQKYQPDVDVYNVNLFSITKAHIKIESDFNVYDYLMETIKGVVNADVSIGLTQVLMNTARETMHWYSMTDRQVINNLLTPEISVEVGVKYIVNRIKTYGSTNTPSDIALIMRCYNSGSPLEPTSKSYAVNMKYGENGLKYYIEYYTKEKGVAPVLPSGTKPPAQMIDFKNIFSINNMVVGGIMGFLAIWLHKRFKNKRK